MTGRELAAEAKISPSTVNRIEHGNNVHTNCVERYKATLKRLEQAQAAGAPMPGTARLNRTSKRNLGRGRRRPDFAQARKLLRMTQLDVARELNTDAHLISAIEAGWGIIDTKLEADIEALLRAHLDDLKMLWPVVDMPKAMPVDEQFQRYPYTDRRPLRDIPAPVLKPYTPDQLGTVTHNCRPCAGQGIVWNDKGQPFKCPVCDGRGLHKQQEGFGG